jgi:radical SAM superfamily enzyme with C-terminal helix-hairpin-helix motif
MRYAAINNALKEPRSLANRRSFTTDTSERLNEVDYYIDTKGVPVVGRYYHARPDELDNLSEAYDSHATSTRMRRGVYTGHVQSPSNSDKEGSAVRVDVRIPQPWYGMWQVWWCWIIILFVSPLHT